MSFTFPSPAVFRTPVVPTMFLGKPALLLMVAIAMVQIALLAFGRDELGYAVLLCLGLPLGLIIIRIKNITESASTQPEKHWAHDKAALLEIGDQMLAQSRCDKQPLSVLVFDQKHLPELSSIFGADVARQMIAKLARTLQNMATPKGLVIRTEMTTFMVLLPGFCRDEAYAAVTQALGITCSIEFDAGGDEIMLVPDYLVHTVGSDTSSIKDVCEVMCRDIARLQQYEDRRKLSLRRERQSHCSKPTPLMEDEARYTAAAVVRHEKTIPVPFGPR